MRLHRTFYLFSIMLFFSLPGYAQINDGSGIDYLTSAQGLTLISIDSNNPSVKTSEPQALMAIDGNKASFILTPKPGTASTATVFTYQLPALTKFSSFAIPAIGETPSPSQTFIKQVVISGSTESPESGFIQLARATLTTHKKKNEITLLDALSSPPVRWVRVELSDGINILQDKTFFEFSEIIGYGEQETVPLSDHFSGKWKGRGVLIDLKQEGAIVSGCYDRRGDLSGTVSGNILRAIGIGRDDGVKSIFVLGVDAQGNIDGVRSTNGAPFKRFLGAVTDAGTITGCKNTAAVTIGCGSTVYGINFDYDSAVIREESKTVINQLFEGLQTTPDSVIVVEGHTSSEGSSEYNQKLSERRAQSLVNKLVNKGVTGNRISALGLGESQPLADNRDEAGRSLNRRVKISCSSE